VRGLGLILSWLVASVCQLSADASANAAYDLSGYATNPLLQTNGVATVLVFVAVDCPISNRYAPELQRLSQRYTPLGVTFWMVYPDKDSSLTSVRKHVREFKLGDHVLRDPQHVLVKAAGAQITPEVAVFARAGNLVYHGAIDDRYVTLGTQRPEPTRHYLEEALRALLDHRPIPTNRTRAVGCSIPDS
jgi:hypothetical protein